MGALKIATLTWERVEVNGVPPPVRFCCSISTFDGMACVFGGLFERSLQDDTVKRLHFEDPGPFILHHGNEANVESKSEKLEPCGVNLDAPMDRRLDEATQLLDNARAQIAAAQQRLREIMTKKLQLQEYLSQERRFPVETKLAKVSCQLEKSSSELAEKRAANDRLISLWRTETKLGDIAVQMGNEFEAVYKESENALTTTQLPDEEREHKTAILNVLMEYEKYEMEQGCLMRTRDALVGRIPHIDK